MSDPRTPCKDWSSWTLQVRNPNEHQAYQKERKKIPTTGDLVGYCFQQIPPFTIRTIYTHAEFEHDCFLFVFCPCYFSCNNELSYA